MPVLDYMSQYGYEQLTMVTDPAVGLKAIIVIHDTTLGPACGGTRIWPYETEEAAVEDALRLARAMSYKSAAADLPLGGGKGVIIADSHTEKTEAMLRAYGRFIETLGGRYVTTTDVGTTGRDLEYIRQETRHVVGLPTTVGGSGDTSVMTGLGIYMGMKACAKEVWGSDSLAGKKVSMQGFGKVAFNTAHHLLKENAQLVVTDVFESALDRARGMGLEVVSPESIYDVESDIFSPCALGGVLNSTTIPRLTCRVVAGGANNQLLDGSHGDELHRRGILYAPDFAINAGGLINVADELGPGGYRRERAKAKTEQIYSTLKTIFAQAKQRDIPPHRLAVTLAQERIQAVRQLRRLNAAV